MKKLSIFIISYNRQDELKKKISFLIKNYEKKIQIYIVDGSRSKLLINNKKLKKKNIIYTHYPTEDYHVRFNIISKYIKTPFTQIQNDDDYHDPKLLLKCCQLLDQKKNSSYFSCYGKTGIFSNYKNEIYIKTLFEKDKDKYNNFSDKYKRLKSYYIDNPYSPSIYFSVMRSIVLKNIIKIFKRSREYYKDDIQLFAETLITSTAILSGKSIFLNDIFWLRNDSDILKRVWFKKVTRVMKGSDNHSLVASYLLDSHRKRGYLNKFFMNIHFFLKINENKNFYLKKISEIFENYYLICEQNNKRKKFNLINYLFGFVKKILPTSLKKFIRFKFNVNGPGINKIIKNNKIVNYKFRKNFLINLKEVFLNAS